MDHGLFEGLAQLLKDVRAAGLPWQSTAVWYLPQEQLTAQFWSVWCGHFVSNIHIQSYLIVCCFYPQHNALNSWIMLDYAGCLALVQLRGCVPVQPAAPRTVSRDSRHPGSLFWIAQSLAQLLPKGNPNTSQPNTTEQPQVVCMTSNSLRWFCVDASGDVWSPMARFACSLQRKPQTRGRCWNSSVPLDRVTICYDMLLVVVIYDI